MKTKRIKLAALLLLLSTLNSQLSTVLAQGGLTPPGAPAPTMKTLDQVEPRTDVLKLSGDGNSLFIIIQPGSYYLTTNIVGVAGRNGISIASGNVTLDLRGFALLGVPGSFRGVYVSSTYTNITVRNGTVSGWTSGVDAYNFGSPRNVVIERLTVSANGGDGIEGGNACLIRDCLSYNNGSTGIYCNSGQVRDCVVRDNGTIGIDVTPGMVSGCLAQNNGRSGIYVDAPGSEVTGNTCIGNNTSLSAGHAGIYINDSNNRIEGNHVSASGILGIKVNSPTYVNNVVIKNTVSDNGVNNYAGTAGNDFGPVGTAAASTSPWANISH